MGNVALPERAGAPEDTLEITWQGLGGPWVVEVGSPQETRSIALTSGERIVLGSGPRADLRVSDPAVSSRHCSLSATSCGIELEDLGSKNGTVLGRARVGKACLPAAGGEFVIGWSSVAVRPLRSDDLVPEGASLPGIVGSSPAMRRVACEVARIAPLKAPVLLQGESGTGKDLVARALHELSRRSGAFVPLNVGALTESIVDAELFGHRRGAFTGAVETRVGVFEQANRGTLFLDEVAELSASAQVKLLRVVEDGCVRAVGATQLARVDVRIVSATWAPLSSRVELQQFRGDLFHRLSTFTIELPPLRSRRSDLPALCRVLLTRLEPELGPRRLSSLALAALQAHQWPGNVRELAGVLYRAAACCEGAVIEPEHIQLRAHAKRARRPSLTVAESRGLLDKHRGNLSAAARAAGVPRSTFRFWLERGKPSEDALGAGGESCSSADPEATDDVEFA